MPLKYAHRGWSAGKGDGWIENTLEAFNKSAKEDIDGIEIDVRQNPETKEPVLSHDPIELDTQYTTLDDAIEYAKTKDWKVLIELKEPPQGLLSDILKILKKYNMQDKAVIFGFINTAKHLPWDAPREVKYGIIVKYPWHISKIVAKYKPDVILLGWDERKWTQLAFRLWWSVFALVNLKYRYGVSIICGIANSKSQINWLNNQNISGYTIDMENCKY